MSKGSRFILAMFWANIVFGLLWQPFWLLLIAIYKVCLEKNYENSMEDNDAFYSKQGYDSTALSGESVSNNKKHGEERRNAHNNDDNSNVLTASNSSDRLSIDDHDEKKETIEDLDNYHFNTRGNSAKATISEVEDSDHGHDHAHADSHMNRKAAELAIKLLDDNKNDQ